MIFERLIDEILCADHQDFCLLANQTHVHECVMSCEELEVVIKPNHYFVVGTIRCDESLMLKDIHVLPVVISIQTCCLCFFAAILCVLFVLLNFFRNVLLVQRCLKS